MEQSVYAVESEVEATHWWFTERRRLFARVIGSLNLPADARILDIGTSTGTNLRMLRELGFRNFEGLDASPEAIRWCAEKGLGKVTAGDICDLPFADNQFDLVLATDIIEHVDDDATALQQIARVLTPTGCVLITVPTFMSLWGLQDDVSHHKRRYRSGPLHSRVRGAGLRVLRGFYFNYILFAPIWMVRRLLKMSKKKLDSEAQINSPLINRVMKWVFRFDVATAPTLHPPFGVSYLVLATPDKTA
jgi:SAM-dependent methyltransferase